MGKGIGAALIVLVSGIAGAWPAAVARAGTCGTFSADSGDNTIILGEKTSYFYYQGQIYYYGLGELAICWLDTNELHQQSFFPNCDTGTPSSDHIYVSALGGADVVWPNTEGHICKVGYPSSYMLAFDEDVFDFYLQADMGTGSDKAYGTEHGDVLLSNKYGTFGNLLPADSAVDDLCGYGGNDTLYGDHDDTDTYEETLHGGDGTDTCNGGFDGSYYDWANYPGCNSISSAYQYGGDYGDCADDRDHNNAWWF